jgi:hypothetical protein
MNTRYDLINAFIKARNYKSFLEIGTAGGETFRAVNCERKVSVDPCKEAGATFQMTSDEFFATNKERFDIVFVDGFHEWHQAERDVRKALKVLSDCGVVIMHDCKPDSEACARHLDVYEEPKGAWCGDVWKAFVKLRATLPFAIYTWNHDWGCGVIDTQFITLENEKSLPEDIENLTYKDFVNHPEWMDFQDEPLGIDFQ